jgi:hypothetical protein
MLVLPSFYPYSHTGPPSSFSDIRFHYHSPLQPSQVICHGVTTPITHCTSIQLKHNTNPFLNRSTQNQDPTKPTWHHRLHQHHQPVLRSPASTTQRTIHRSLSRLPRPFSNRNRNLFLYHHPNPLLYNSKTMHFTKIL